VPQGISHALGSARFLHFCLYLAKIGHQESPPTRKSQDLLRFTALGGIPALGCGIAGEAAVISQPLIAQPDK